MGEVQEEAVLKCASVNLKFRYKDFIAKDHPDYNQMKGIVWHSKARDLVYKHSNVINGEQVTIQGLDAPIHLDGLFRYKSSKVNG